MLGYGGNFCREAAVDSSGLQAEGGAGHGALLAAGHWR